MTVRELRLVVTVDDHEQALRFYRDVLGLPQVADFSSAEGRCVLLDAGRATVEAGATILAEPTRTPWNSLNARLTAPDGVQLTLFEEPDTVPG